MTSALVVPYQRLLSEYRAGTVLALLFDFDGTLAPFADDPAAVACPASTCRALARLVRIPRVHVGIISGRCLADLRERVDIAGFFLGGTSGLELDFYGLTVRHPQAAQSLAGLQLLERSLVEAIGRFPGAWLERKPLGMTLHYRRVPRHRHSELRSLAGQFVEACSQQVDFFDGAAAFEIVPRLGWNKGTAVRMFMNSINAPDAVILYAGDNSNDRCAMTVTAASGGITIGVGREAPTCAQFVVQNPEQLGDFVLELAERLAESVVCEELGTADCHERGPDAA